MLTATLLLTVSLLSFRDAATGFAVPADARLAAHAAGESVPTTVWVKSSDTPEELRPSVVLAQLRPAQMFFHGHVSDTATGLPLEGALVIARSSGVTARTDARGYFSMHVAAYEEDGLPAGEDLRVTTDGYRTHTIRNTALMSGSDTHFIIRMESGAGETSRDDSHKIWLHRPGGEHPHQDQPDRQEPAGVPMVSVPETIRVGFGCTTGTNCTSVEVFPIDVYVKRGLNDEWIASWPQDSLRAGAVAYRSYGAWHVAHPRTATYDICSTTSCQVNDADTSVSTDIAVDATIGYVVVQNGEIFRAEYSAELNNLRRPDRSCSNIDPQLVCGDGSAGSPPAFWPCLPDPVCTGSSCFGHGRGMCQWGTERWARQLKDWRWIVRHYYSDGGGLRSSVLVGPNDHLPRRRAVGR